MTALRDIRYLRENKLFTEDFFLSTAEMVNI